MKTSIDEEHLVNAVLATIGKKLTQLRKEKGFKTHAEFAEQFDLPKIQYWRMEKGKANVTLKSLSRVTNLHKIPVDKFFQLLVEERERQ
jgi:transcriptional regulator with XRE-family HTH domain